MSRTRNMIGSVAGFVAWWPAMVVGLCVAPRRESGAGADLAEWAEGFAGGVAVAVENQIKLWGWPGSEEQEAAPKASVPVVDNADNPFAAHLPTFIKVPR